MFICDSIIHLLFLDNQKKYLQKIVILMYDLVLFRENKKRKVNFSIMLHHTDLYRLTIYLIAEFCGLEFCNKKKIRPVKIL